MSTRSFVIPAVFFAVLGCGESIEEQRSALCTRGAAFSDMCSSSLDEPLIPQDCENALSPCTETDLETIDKIVTCAEGTNCDAQQVVTCGLMGVSLSTACLEGLGIELPTGGG